jgi:hypothetical protein
MIRFSPHPPGKSFAITFVDDTDQSTRENTEPVYDFLAERGFWGTKTVWPVRAKRSSAFRRELEMPVRGDDPGATLEDPDYTDFIRKLQGLGFEIALHGVAGGNSTRDEILAGLSHYRHVIGHLPSINVFHQTNIENLYCGSQKLDSPLLRSLEQILHRSAYEGHREGAPSFWGDIVKDTFRYVRLPFHTIDDVNTLRVNPSMPFHDPRRPYVQRWFASSDGSDVVRFNRLLSDKNVARLRRQRGVCIVYTHFAKKFARPGKAGYSLDGDFVRTVERVTSDSRAWFPTASKLLERLDSIRSLKLSHVGRRLEIEHQGDRPVDGLVMHVADGMEIRSADGAALERGTGFVVLPLLAPGSVLTLATNRAGNWPTGAAQCTHGISRKERRRIEYCNYRGLIRGTVKDRLYYSTGWSF